MKCFDVAKENMQEVGRADVYGNPAVATPDVKAERRTILLWAHHSGRKNNYEK